MSTLLHRGHKGFKCEPPGDLLDGSTSTVWLLSVNRSYGVVLLEDGSYREWGAGFCGERFASPFPTIALSFRIRSISCGAGHVVAAVESGGLVSWGCGQCPSTEEMSPRQRQVLGLGGCCSNDSCISCSSRRPIKGGGVLSPGSKKRLRGAGEADPCSSRTGDGVDVDAGRVEGGRASRRASGRAWWVSGELRHRIVLEVSAGDSYTVVLVQGPVGSPVDNDASTSSDPSQQKPSTSTRTSSLWSWGVGDCGQLGLGITNSEYAQGGELAVACIPQPIQFPQRSGTRDGSQDGAARSGGDGSPCSIDCGPFHAATVNEQGHLFTFG